MKKKHAWMGVNDLRERAKAAQEEVKLAEQAVKAAQQEANHDERPLKCVQQGRSCIHLVYVLYACEGRSCMHVNL
jgi:hypothetical protein